MLGLNRGLLTQMATLGRVFVRHPFASFGRPGPRSDGGAPRRPPFRLEGLSKSKPSARFQKEQG